MFLELTQEQYNLVRSLFDALTFNIQVPSILDGNTRGAVFVDDTAQPRTALIWDRLASLYFTGEPGQAGVNAGLRAWIAGAAIPTARQIGFDALTLHYDPLTWETRLPIIFTGYTLEKGLRRFHKLQRPGALPSNLPQGFHLHPVDAQLVGRQDLQNHAWLLAWITSFWHSAADFVDRGVGYCVLDRDETIVNLCLSVFVSGPSYEFGTATQESYQNRGLATAAATACVAHCLERGLEPIWHCWDDNLASIAVTRKVGFALQAQYPVLRLCLT